MQRLSNRLHPEKSNAAPQVQYVDRVVEKLVPAEPEIRFYSKEIPESEPQIVYVDRVIEKLVQQEPAEIAPISTPVEIDLQPLQDQIDESNKKIKLLIDFAEKSSGWSQGASAELEMQRRALVAIKTQRDVDRSRRLMLIKRLKKQQDEQKKLNFKLKAAVAVAILIPLLLLFIRI